MASDNDKPIVLHMWSARKLHPIIVIYVILVFVICMAISYFVVHSMTAVKALALAAVGVIVPLLPAVINKTEYQLTESGLEKRLLDRKNPREFKDVFRWDYLSHVVPIKHGFKFYNPINEKNPIRRFWKTHISDSHSGEFRVETGDRDIVLGILKRRDVPLSKPEI